MSHQNRNILFIVLGCALLLCCCCALLTAAAVSIVPWGGTGGALDNGNAPSPRPVTVITRVITATPQAGTPSGATPRPLTATPQAGTPSGATPTPAQKPESSTPRPTSTEQVEALPTPTQSEPRTLGADTTALLAEAAMPARDLRELAMRLKPGLADVPVVVNATPPVYKVGDTAEFWISNNDTQDHKKVTAELRYITSHVYMWVEKGQDVSQADLEASAQRFETETYVRNREFFGSEWTPGVDDDVHLSILHAEGLGENVAGYYSSADEYSNRINPYSNQREMFYISTGTGSATPNTSFYDGTLAHEFQHMIHWANDRNEDSWVTEGMSELAGFLNGFDPGGADIAYMDTPDTQLTTWPASSAEPVEQHYGASYLFMNYFFGRFGEDLTKAVIASLLNGIAGFDDALSKAGRPERFDDIFADWVVANYLDEPGADPQGRFGYPEIDPSRPTVAKSHRIFPASERAQVHQYGTDYIRLRGNGDFSIDFEGQQQNRLVDADLLGSYSWWSNRGDDSDSTLTRPFDLSALSKATLTFSTWYQLEDGWDYAYVEASTDGGKTWQVLPGLHTTSENPVGNAFGVGWTGISGGGDTPQWTDEKVDLTGYAGKKILLRFEYVTDDAVNLSGLLLDNVAIPELGFADDGEAGTNGWEAAGWVLTDNVLEQRWLVQLMELGDTGVTVQRMDVGPDGRGQFILTNLGGLNEAVLAVSGLSPVTTELADYSYSIEKR